jgi:uncharacterized membrane protein (UPF0127 family)
MKTAERIIMLAIVAVLCGGAWWFYDSVGDRRDDFRARVAAGEFERPLRSSGGIVDAAPDNSNPLDETEWRRYYPVVYPMTVGDVPVQASVADTLTERMKGLSNTPYLPTNVVKLFAFGTPGSHSIWMKDMNYPIDIIWADEDGMIVHIEENVSPITYDRNEPNSSKTFASPVPAWYVVETNAGFIAQHEIEIGARITLPTAG